MLKCWRWCCCCCFCWLIHFAQLLISDKKIEISKLSSWDNGTHTHTKQNKSDQIIAQVSSCFRFSFPLISVLEFISRHHSHSSTRNTYNLIYIWDVRGQLQIRIKVTFSRASILSAKEANSFSAKRNCYGTMLVLFKFFVFVPVESRIPSSFVLLLFAD